MTAILTGAVAVVLGVAYLLLTLVLDSRGFMQPAPDLEVGWRTANFVAWLIL